MTGAHSANGANGANGINRINEANHERNVSVENRTLIQQNINGINESHRHITGSEISRLHEGPMKERAKAPEPIAIVGIGMRLPGRVHSAEAFWDFLLAKKNGRCRVPADRFNIDAFYSPLGKPGTVKMQHGHFLDVDLAHFDAAFFSMNKTEVERLDPQQRILLEVVWECMENGGQKAWRGENIGCYVGAFGEDWLDLASKDTQSQGLYRVTGSGDFALANRVSYEYNLKGPSVTIRTACSSSLIGLHEACQAIYNGECTSAVIAGTNLIMTPTMSIAMTEQGVLSPSGSCRSFDAAADGYARGEAINAIYVKPLSSAIRNGDPIRAVIRATATNCDGKTSNIAYPSSETHERMIRRAYEVAQLPELSQTAFVECHGTGTAVGDPLEAVAVANVFGHQGVYIGSVKPNVGHSEGASGITSLVKATMALENRTIPPNINFTKPNPKIPFESAQLQVPLEPTPWPQDRYERASVNSFGIGGANAHVILDSAASFGIHSSLSPVNQTSTRPHLLVFSANDSASLTRIVSQYQEYVSSYPSALGDLAYTLGTRREHMKHRAFSVLEAGAPLVISPFSKPKAIPKINFIFTGQGAQWAGMGRALMKDFIAFHEDIRAMDNVLAQSPDPPNWTIEDTLLTSDKTDKLDKAEYSQPLCTAVQIGLVNLLKTWGVSPAAVVGHSSGEIAAAYASGAITADTAIIIAYYRGQVTKKQTRRGRMAAVGMGRDEVTPYLAEGVVLACENSPRSVTLSGDEGKLATIIEEINSKRPEVSTRHLKVEMAYHSQHMHDLGDAYQSLLENHVFSRQPAIPFFSSVTGKAIARSDQLGPSYWRDNLESPVLFYSAVKMMMTVMNDLSNDKLFLEIGPHSALAGPLRQIFKAITTEALPTYFPTLVRGKNCTESLLTTVGQLHLQSVPIDFVALTPSMRVLTNLPNYQWNHETSYWSESRVSREWRLRKFPRHELLGSRIMEGNDMEPTWRNMLRLEDVPFLREHKIIDDIVFPCAGYVAMAGEAIRQISGTGDFTLRRVVVKAALVMQESKSSELITSLRPVRLTDSSESIWYDFSILSYNGTSWIKHCVGQVRAGSEEAYKQRNVEKLPRIVSAPSWYLTMKRAGLNYGPAFQGLSEISASPIHGTAVASLLDTDWLSESAYQLHPTTIDHCLQLFTVAISKGMPRHLTRLCVPTNIEQLYIRRGGPQMRVKAVASPTPKGGIHGDLVVMADGEVVLHLKQGEFSPLEDEDPTINCDTIAAAQLDWKPDIDFVPVESVIRPYRNVRDSTVKLERIALLCMLETLHRVSSIETEIDYLKKYRSWLKVQAARARKRKYAVLEGAHILANLSQLERLSHIKSASKDMETLVGADVSKVLLRIVDHCEAMFEGNSEPVEILLQDDGLKSIYDYQDLLDCRDYFALLGHSNPTIKILEIGAGTGGTTAGLLRDLKSRFGERLYSTYTYTDISPGFFVTAKDRFKDYHNIEYKVLDISKDPIEQGFQSEFYDFILASNVIHATPSIGSTLRNVRKLLAPGGRLFLQELAPTMKMFNYIMGLLPGWWLGAEDGRADEPYISAGRWDKELRNAGFTGTDAVIYDDEWPYQSNSTILSSCVEDASPSKEVAILYEAEISPLARQVEALLIKAGYCVAFSNFDQIPPANHDVVSLLDLTSPFFDNISAKSLKTFQRYMENLKTGMLWVTRSAQFNCKDPRYSQVLGIARTSRSELSTDFATFEIDEVTANSMDALIQVLSKFQRRRKDSPFDPELEFAFSNGTIQIPRFHWISVSERLSTKLHGEQTPKKLNVGRFGLLHSLHWLQEKPIDTLVSGQIEVEPRADILVSMGLVGGTADGIGLEGSGIIRRIGPDVEGLQVSDRVLIFGRGCFTTRFVTSAKLCAKIPDNLSFEEAATMPCVYSTVIYSLMTVGQLERGQTVLIHSACGGVGLAAIQICKMIGAQIFVTVGNEEKARYLMETFGFPREDIFDSRCNSFLPNIMARTKGKGVDLVLNSLSGELLHASWQCVAPFGKMLEIGKRDFIGRGMLEMDIFEANRSFFGIDLAQLAVERPETCRDLLEQCMHYYQQGTIQPIKPMKLFEGTQIIDAFRYMQKGQHIGKIVVTMPENPETLEETATKEKLALRSESSYLLVGGLGGLGRAISTWMVEHGARNLVYLSRSAGKSLEDESFFHELEAQGCLVQCFPGSVTNLDDVKHAVSNATMPIAGVMQMSMVLKDGGILKLSHQDWQAAVEPKVDGTWNLHNVLAKSHLDFFVLFSSISCIVGQWGQANYAAANAFLEGFVQYRQSLGLPASALSIGVMEDVGYVSQNQAVLDQLKATNYYTLREQDLLDALQLTMVPSSASKTDSAQLAIGLRSTKPLADPTNRSVWKRDIRMCLYRNLEIVADFSSGGANEALQQLLVEVAANPSTLDAQSSVDLLTREIGVQLYNFMVRSVDELDVKQSLSAFGVDSLVAIEIRNWWRRSLGLEISVLEILNSSSIEELGRVAAKGLQNKYIAEPVTENGNDTYLLMKAP